MQTHEIRKRFLDHFVNAGHTEVPSASVILDDPNLLFVNAGMVQFVPYFLGQRTPPWNRATSIQKCIRTPDIDEVGITTRHNTFFQMAGNFSLRRLLQEGRHRAGLDAADQPRRPGRLRLRPRTALGDRLSRRRRGRSSCGRRSPGCRSSASSAAAWPTTTGRWASPDRAARRSEIYYDRGPEYGIEGGPEANEDRYIEIWNLVFMQNERGEGTSKENFEILGPLPRKNIDTGMGVERVACLLQGVDNVYETDLLRPVIDLVAGSRAARVRRRATTTTTSATGSSPTTAAPRRSSSPTASAPATTAAATCCAACCAGSSGPPSCWASTQPIIGELMATVRDAMGPSYPGAGHRLRPDPAHRGRRGDGVQPHAGVGFAAVRRRRRRDEGRRASPCCPAPTRSPCTTPTASRSN